MRRYAYTEREVLILTSKEPLEISDEEFLALYHKAHHRNSINFLKHLNHVYPEISDRVFSYDFIKNHLFTVDLEENYIYPILCPVNRTTEGRICNMVSYLTGKMRWPQSMRNRLYTTVPYRQVYNYYLDRYVKDFETEPLWEVFFLGQPELAQVIEKRRISSYEELVYRTMNYFDRYVQSIYAKCRKERPEGA